MFVCGYVHQSPVCVCVRVCAPTFSVCLCAPKFMCVSVCGYVYLSSVCGCVRVCTPKFSVCLCVGVHSHAQVYVEVRKKR